MREVLDNLVATYPALRERIFDGDELPQFLNVFVDGADVRLFEGLETAVPDGTTVILLPAVAGGGENGRPMGSHGPALEQTEPPATTQTQTPPRQPRQSPRAKARSACSPSATAERRPSRSPSVAISSPIAFSIIFCAACASESES